ncbi:MAG: hypothetical protein EDS66_17840 [Planctomycetota bacterium]|nr:MAG: hypothetical protein EDS66_17840 [Planctomycetota bacterium]
MRYARRQEADAGEGVIQITLIAVQAPSGDFLCDGRVDRSVATAVRNETGRSGHQWRVAGTAHATTGAGWAALTKLCAELIHVDIFERGFAGY